MSKIIVGVDESQASLDAIALARSLSSITGAEVVLANVFPYERLLGRGLDRAFEDTLRAHSFELLERLRSAHADEHAELVAVANPSPAHGLHELAQAEGAGLIVVGSTHTGRAGRLLPGSSAERLLHGSPCPVAVAPKDYRQHAERRLATIACAHDGSPTSQRAFEAALALASSMGSTLRVIRAFQPLAYDVAPGSTPVEGVTSYNDTLQERAANELQAAVAGTDAEAELVVGEPGHVLVEASEALDLLLVGSRGYGPLHAVLVGGVSGRVVREAACPVIVFPRTAGEDHSDPLFSGAASLNR